MAFVWAKDGKFYRTLTVAGEYGNRYFAASALTSGKAGWIAGWKLMELDSPEGFFIAHIGQDSGYLVREFDAAIEDHLFRHPYTLEQAADFATDNEALSLKGEEKLGAAQKAFDNASVYADEYGFTVKSFQRELSKRGAR